MEFAPLPERLEHIARLIVDAIYTVHKRLGPGLLESVYEECLVYELRKRGLKAERQVPIPITYDDREFDTGFRIDVRVEDDIFIELKAVVQMLPVFTSQLLSYIRLAGKRLGFLVNCNVPYIRNGIKRIVL
jgi:GxxExxY protein